MRGQLVVAASAVIGLGLGALLDVLTVLMAAAGPAGEGWSFRGNGALVVPFGLSSALLSGGWTALLLYARGSSSWKLFGSVIGVAALVPSALSIIVLVLFGHAAQSLSDLMAVPTLSWPLLSLTAAMLLDLRRAPSRRLPRECVLGAGLIFAVALAAGFYGAELLLSPGAS